MRYDNIKAHILGPDGEVLTTPLGGVSKIDQDLYDEALKEDWPIGGKPICPCCAAPLYTEYSGRKKRKTEFGQTALTVTDHQSGFRHADAKAEAHCREVLKATHEEVLRFFMHRLTGQKELSDALKRELDGIGRFQTKDEDQDRLTDYWWVKPFRIILGVGTRERNNSKSKENARYGYEGCGGTQEYVVIDKNGKEETREIRKKLRLCFVNNVRDKTDTAHDKKGKIIGTTYVPLETKGRYIEFDISEDFAKKLYASYVRRAATRHLPDKNHTLDGNNL
jgi:hypothetical protein